MELMPAVDKLQSILDSSQLELVMVDATQQRYVDLYCHKQASERDDDDKVSTDNDSSDSETAFSDDSRDTGCICGACIWNLINLGKFYWKYEKSIKYFPDF